MWNNIQLSKGQMKKDRLIEVEIGNNRKNAYYRSASCLEVKMCPGKRVHICGPNKRKKELQNTHSQKKDTIRWMPSGTCVYLSTILTTEDGLGVFFEIKKDEKNNVHNHELHGAFKIRNLVQGKISHAVQSN